MVHLYSQLRMVNIMRLLLMDDGVQCLCICISASEIGHPSCWENFSKKQAPSCLGDSLSIDLALSTPVLSFASLLLCLYSRQWFTCSWLISACNFATPSGLPSVLVAEVTPLTLALSC